MIWWGAIWGALLGLLVGRIDDGALIVGAVLGALAGWTLQRVIDRRVMQLLRKGGAASEAASAKAAPRPPSDVFPPTAPQPRPAAAVPATAETIPTVSVAAAPITAPAPAASTYAAPVEPAALSAPMAPSVTPSPIEDLLARAKAWLVGGNTVARLGALLLFVGLSFLARFAVERGLVPPQLRLAAIGVVAIVFLVLGFRLRERRTGYALTLQGAGIAILYLTLFAAFRLYGFLPPVPAFGLMVAVCALSAVLAVLQDARALAVIGAAGGFLAPILASTGQGDHVALFGYYTVLNLGIFAIAWKKDWRLLNWVGFVFTFGIATLWGVLRYRPELYTSTQPFLIVFFLLYVAIAVLFALRRAPRLTAYADGTLIFGLPLIGFGLQAALVRDFEFGLAWSALALAGLYLGLAALLAQRRLETLRLLVEGFLALGVIFLSLAIPFALDARWTAAAWALEGAGIVWIGVRQQRRLARAFGLLLQAAGALAFIKHLAERTPQAWPLANADFVGAVLLAGAAIFVSRQLSRAGAKEGKPTGYAAFEQAIAAPLFLYGFAWWLGALALELTRRRIAGVGDAIYAVAPDDRLFLFMLGYVASATFAAWRGTRIDRRAATWPAYGSLPLMLAIALLGSLAFRHVFEHLGWFCWPLAVLTHLIGLRWIDRGAPAAWFTGVHAGGVYLLLLLVGSVATYLIDAAALWRTSWGPAALAAGLAVLLFVIGRAAFSNSSHRVWPMARFARAYGWIGLVPVAVLLFTGALLMTVTQRGDATPLPHLPLVNPTDLAFLLALAALWQWRGRLAASGWSLPAWVTDRRVAWSLVGGAVFVWLNTVWLRVAHHFAGVPWRVRALFDSFLVQTGYALLWTAIAVGLMVFASRRQQRAPWLIGATLLGVTVLKLLVVDLSNAGGTERIVAFVGVGALMLVVGYLAPLPPQAAAAKTKGQTV
jgi:uncharacterized membrane protein